MNFSKQKNLNEYEKIYNRKIDCSINKASNEIMLHRISGGREIEFPFCSWNNEYDEVFINIGNCNVSV